MSSTTPDMPRVAASRIARVNWGASAAALLLLMLCPLFMGDYYLHAMILAMVFLLPALGLNLILGYTGMLSLAQGVFFGIGAYASALLSIHYGTSFLVNFLAAGLIAGIVALPLGIPALRLRNTSFVMCTLGLVVIAQMVSKNWISLTRGDMGLSGVSRPKLGFGCFQSGPRSGLLLPGFSACSSGGAGVCGAHQVPGRTMHGCHSRQRNPR